MGHSSIIRDNKNKHVLGPPVAQRVEDLALSLLLLEVTVVARGQSLAWEFMHAVGVAKKGKQNKQKKVPCSVESTFSWACSYIHSYFLPHLLSLDTCVC